MRRVAGQPLASRTNLENKRSRTLQQEVGVTEQNMVQEDEHAHARGVGGPCLACCCIGDTLLAAYHTA